jgi:hypothetical protein
MDNKFEEYYLGFITNKPVEFRETIAKKTDLFVDHINFIDYFGTTFKFLALSHIKTNKYLSRKREEIYTEAKEQELKIKKVNII